MIAGICLLAFGLTFVAAGRGFFPLDQSIVFDGAYRIASGQVPYRDFLLPFGPAAFWLQALLFEIFGVGAFAYRLGGALANTAGTVCAIAIVRALFPRLRLLSWLSGILTAAWFCAPFGTLWMEQTAFLFSFLALALLVRALPTLSGRGRGPALSLAASGVLAFVAFLGKQNAGAYVLWLYPALLALALWPSLRGIAWAISCWAAGLAGAVLLFALWLFAGSDPAAFHHHVFEIPAELGADRLGRDWLSLLLMLTTGAGPDFLRLPLLATSGFAVLVLLGALLRPAGDRTRLVAALLCAGLALAQNLFIFTTFNAYENGLPFAGVVFALGTALLVTGPVGAQRAAAISALAVLTTLYVFWRGAGFAIDRRVHDIFVGARYPRVLSIERLSGLRWAEPTKIREVDDPPRSGRDVSEQDLEQLVSFLAASGANFFVFPDFTFLYGVVGRPSPQPLLFFHRGNSYSKRYEASLDQRIVADLEANQVRTVVLEGISWFGTEQRLADFPLLAAFIAANFEKTREIGIFEIRERRSPPAARQSARARPATGSVPATDSARPPGS
jgi:hypothetical protein